MDTIVVKNAVDTVCVAVGNQGMETVGTQGWGWGGVALVCVVCLFLLTLLFLFYRYRHSDRYEQKQRLKGDAEMNMDNIVNSTFLAKSLYDKLKVRCHPDRFLDEQRRSVATQIAQEMNENKYNYKKLCELKERAEDELNVKF